MAYGNSAGDNARLLLRTIRGVADFSGRSRRTEVVYYWVACALLSVMLTFSVNSFASFKISIWFGTALQFLLLIPTYALFVRRLHDQNRTGWWGLLLPLSVLLSVPRVLAEVRGDFHAMIAQKFTPIGIASGLMGLAVLVLCFLPATDGPNRYGADPRLEEN